MDQYDLTAYPEDTDTVRDQLEEMSDQFLADVNTPFFAETENDYLAEYDYAEFTADSILQIQEDIQSFRADREAEREIDRQEAEFGADGTRVFRGDERSYIDHYYVVEDLTAVPLEVKDYTNRDEALNAYFSLPTDRLKAFGVVNTNQLPGSLDFIQCRDGTDVLTEDYLKVEDSAGWQREEILDLDAFLKEQIEYHTMRQAASPVLHPEVHTEQRLNYRIEDDAIGVGTSLERYRNNIAAVRLLKEMEAESRLATSEEQSVLAQYVGWGGLADFFDDTNAHYAELKNLLTDAEYTSARESTLTAFYTPPVVIRAIYQALDNMGFERGNILEPACGIGNFMGMLPDSMAESKLYGVELDSISGRIARQLYQRNNIAVEGFETTDLPDSFFDAAIGNVPFGNFKLSDRRYDRNNFLIHDYFFAKTLDKVRPGGIIAFITSHGTLDKENPTVRRYIAQRAELIGAIRLPNDTFVAAAGTEVTSDVIFLQKRDRLMDLDPEWVHLSQNEDDIAMNAYFIAHPEMILGDMRMVSGPFGERAECIAREGMSLAELLQSAVAELHAQITEYARDEEMEQTDSGVLPADPDVRNYSYTIVDGNVYYRENSIMRPVDLSATAQSRVKGMITIQYLAGHKNSKITMDIYAKAKYNRPEELSAIVNAAFNQNVALAN